MTPFLRRFLPAIAAVLLFPAASGAEAIFPVNDNTLAPGVFDQPAVVASGNILHVAFVGDNTSGNLSNPDTRLYYAAVNGAANFADKALERSQVILTPAVAIHNGSYTQARHPQIAMRSATQMVILFQAIPTAPPGITDSKLFRALITLENNAVKTQLIDEIKDSSVVPLTGKLTDLSFGLVTTDNTLRVAYAEKNTGDVYYARVGLDNALLVESPRLLTQQPHTRGTAPLPRLRLDGTNRSHVVWAANNDSAAPSGIYYALVQQASPGSDNLAIGATEVLSGPNRWGFPSVLLTPSGYVLVLAADEPFGTAGIGGPLGVSLLNPRAVVQDGNPVNVGNLGANASFFLYPPGMTVLPSNFDTYRPETAIDAQNRVFVAGYGYLGGPPFFQGTPGRYYGMGISNVYTTVATIAGFAEMFSPPLPVGLGEIAFATELPDDYTRPAFTLFSDKAIHFWSGPALSAPGNGVRNLYITTTASASIPPTAAAQSGCSAVDDPRRGESGRIPGALPLFLPAVLIALRRVARKAFAL